MESLESSLNINCQICKDAGFVHSSVDGHVDYSLVVPCECVKEIWKTRKKAEMAKQCELPPEAEKMDFNNFEVSTDVKFAFQEAKEMADNPGKLCWLALIGKNGNGKTHLAVGICKAWLSAGIPAKYTLVSLLLEELRKGIPRSGEESFERRFAYYCNVPLLLMDDYGIESSTRWVQEKLDTLIDYRLMHSLSLIITSNLSLEEMPPRIRSRIMRHPNRKIVAIMADDYALRDTI